MTCRCSKAVLPEIQFANYWRQRNATPNTLAVDDCLSRMCLNACIPTRPRNSCQPFGKPSWRTPLQTSVNSPCSRVKCTRRPGHHKMQIATGNGCIRATTFAALALLRTCCKAHNYKRHSSVTRTYQCDENKSALSRIAVGQGIKPNVQRGHRPKCTQHRPR